MLSKIIFFLTTVIVLCISAQTFADVRMTTDVRITITKGDASLCEVIPTPAPKFNDRYVRHYNKIGEERYVSSDLWKRGKNGLSFFKLNKAQSTSQTVHLAFVYKYSTFWYYTKRGTKMNGPYFYDFIVPEKKLQKKLFVDIDLKLPCSCFERANRPQRCTKDNGVNIHIYKDRLNDWWQQSGKEKANKTGKDVGKGSRKTWEVLKKGARNIKEGWSEQDNEGD